MKIFIVGMPDSGRTTVAKAISKLGNYHYIDATSWIRSSFREPKDKELPQQYYDELHSWILNRIKLDPYLVVNNVLNIIETCKQNSANQNFVIDGLFSPQDFVQLFESSQDMVVFLNRTNNSSEFKDYENIGIAVIRDFCFWLSSAELLTKHKWIEYNFTIPGDDLNQIKTLGQKNSVFIVRSINRVIEHLTKILIEAQ